MKNIEIKTERLRSEKQKYKVDNISSKYQREICSSLGESRIVFIFFHELVSYSQYGCPVALRLFSII